MIKGGTEGKEVKSDEWKKGEEWHIKGEVRVVMRMVGSVNIVELSLYSCIFCPFFLS